MNVLSWCKWNKFGKCLNELWTWTWITIKLWLCNSNDLVNRFRNLFRNLIYVHIRNEIEFDCKTSINCAKAFLSVFFFYYCQEKQLSKDRIISYLNLLYLFFYSLLYHFINWNKCIIFVWIFLNVLLSQIKIRVIW